MSATDPIISPSETRPREESKPVGSSVPLEQNTRPKPNEIIGKPENATPPLAPAPEPVPPAKRPKTRFVRREWPRPPNPPLGPLKFDPKAVGKRAGTGGLPLWGATLDDFYWYSVVDGVADWSTSSRMLAWVEGLCDKDDQKDAEGSEDGEGSREDRSDEGRDPESDEENMDTGSAEEGKDGKLIEEGRVEESAGRGKDEKTEDRRELQRKEMEAARAEIEFAKEEPEPMLLRPENVLKLVEGQDTAKDPLFCQRRNQSRLHYAVTEHIPPLSGRVLRVQNKIVFISARTENWIRRCEMRRSGKVFMSRVLGVKVNWMRQSLLKRCVTRIWKFISPDQRFRRTGSCRSVPSKQISCPMASSTVLASDSVPAAPYPIPSSPSETRRSRPRQCPRSPHHLLRSLGHSLRIKL